MYFDYRTYQADQIERMHNAITTRIKYRRGFDSIERITRQLSRLERTLLKGGVTRFMSPDPRWKPHGCLGEDT